MSRHPSRPDAPEEFELDQHARITAWFALGGYGGIVDLSIEQATQGPWGTEAAYRDLRVAAARAIAACVHRPPPDRHGRHPGHGPARGAPVGRPPS